MADTETSVSEAAPGAAAQADSGFAKRKNRQNLRKRPADDAAEPAADDAGSAVVRKVKAAKDTTLAFSTRKEGDKLAPFKYESEKVLQQRGDAGATRTLETETEHDRDARALREQVLAQAVDPAAAVPDGTYKGLNQYIDYRKGFRREHTIGAEKGGGLHGPLRANTTMRTSVRWDYQPDVCKDYKETGYCGYGDSCKFVHDRSDYKSGWELEKQYEEQQKQREKMLAGMNANDEGSDKAESEDDDDLPFACHICRRPWAECQDPVTTRCKHYFCEQCALKHNAKTGKCAMCEAPTNGIFNVAFDIIKKAKAQKSVSAGS